MPSRFPGLSYPSGWFRIAKSGDLKPGQIRSLRYFGVDLDLFRTASGQVGLLNAFCPHLGAHLGLGTVQEDAIRCAFHGWQFNTEGVCTRIPGDRRIPPKARAHKWPTCELNGQIMTYYHPRGSAPAGSSPHSLRPLIPPGPAFTTARAGASRPILRICSRTLWTWHISRYSMANMHHSLRSGRPDLGFPAADGIEPAAALGA